MQIQNLEEKNLQQNKTKTQNVKANVIGEFSFDNLTVDEQTAFFTTLLKRIQELALKGGYKELI